MLEITIFSWPTRGLSKEALLSAADPPNPTPPKAHGTLPFSSQRGADGSKGVCVCVCVWVCVCEIGRAHV